jgi:hypothetical protein
MARTPIAARMPLSFLSSRAVLTPRSDSDFEARLVEEITAPGGVRVRCADVCVRVLLYYCSYRGRSRLRCTLSVRSSHPARRLGLLRRC